MPNFVSMDESEKKKMVSIFPSIDDVIDNLYGELVKKCPGDIYQFCYSYFGDKLQEQRKALLKLTKQSLEDTGIMFNGEKVICDINYSSDETDNVYLSGNEIADTKVDLIEDSEDDGDELFVPPTFNRARRTSVSAESMAPTNEGEFEKIFIEKTGEQRKRIEAAISQNFLFKNLDEEQYRDVIDAMAEKKVNTGDDVIIQGGVGDYFYAIESGKYEVYVSRPDQGESKVHEYSEGGSFGELALMYNSPRAATVRCAQGGELWALDRVTFRRILMQRTFTKRQLYEKFLEEVPVLANLEPYERHKVADALESIVYNNGEIVIRQGDNGENFYVIESGEASVIKVDENGEEHKVGELKKGDYFGELALLNNKNRSATVISNGRLKCATLGKKAFVRLLGPVVEIIKRNSENYQKAPTKST